MVQTWFLSIENISVELSLTQSGQCLELQFENYDYNSPILLHKISFSCLE